MYLAGKWYTLDLEEPAFGADPAESLDVSRLQDAGAVRADIPAPVLAYLMSAIGYGLTVGSEVIPAQHHVPFEEAMRDAAVERVEQTRFGPALFNDTHSIVWMLNVLRVETPEDATAEEIAAEAERVQGESGIRHRRVLVTDPEAGKRLAPGFAALGWKPDNFVFMVRRHEPEKLADTSIVTEVAHDDLTRLRRAINLELLPETTPDELDQVMASSHLFEGPGRARIFR